MLISLAIAALLVGSVVAWFASAMPDGLEWSIGRTYGEEELSAPKTGIIPKLAKIQEKTSFLPDYGFKDTESEEPASQKETGEDSWPNVSVGTSVSGVVGSVIVLALVGLLGLAMVKLRGKTKARK